jgi:hypothetical protein
VPDQPALTPRTAFADIWPTALGVLFLADRRGFNANDEFLWRLQGTQWEGISLRPRRPSQQRLIHRRWREVRPLLADNDGVWAHLRDNLISDAEGLWVRLIADEIEEAPYWHSVNPKDMFQTPDRTIYRTYQGSLLRWRGMQWRVTGSDKRIQRQDFLLPGAHGRKVVVLGDQTLPWIYYDVEYGRVYCIREGGDGLQLESCRFFGATSKPGPILDAAYTGGGMYGIVTVRGVFILNAITGQLHEIRSPEPASRIRSMCRDGSGRLWLVGDRLHLSSTNGQSWTSLVDLPMVGPTETKRLRANPGDPSGVILALHDRGVVFLTTH